MVECAYCGRENDDAAVSCRECGTTEFKVDKTPSVADGPTAARPEDLAALVDLQKRGCTRLAMLLGFWLGIMIVVNAVYLAPVGFDRLPLICVRIALTIGLGYAIWLGHNWARKVSVVLGSLGILMIVRRMSVTPSAWVLSSGFCVLTYNVLLILGLTRSAAIAAFLSYQRSRRQSRTQP